MDPGQDDFREDSALLFGARECYRSARAIIVHTVDGEVADESNRRFVDWRFARPGGSGMGKLRSEEERRHHGPDVAQDFYHEYEDTKEVIRLWHEEPDRWREERYGPEGALLRCIVAASRGARSGSMTPPRLLSTCRPSPNDEIQTRTSPSCLILRRRYSVSPS